MPEFLRFPVFSGPDQPDLSDIIWLPKLVSVQSFLDGVDGVSFG